MAPGMVLGAIILREHDLMSYDAALQTIRRMDEQMRNERSARMKAEARLEQLRSIVTHDRETKDELISRIRSILYDKVPA